MAEPTNSTAAKTEPQTFDAYTRIVSYISLFVSGSCAIPLLKSVHGGQYGGTALAIFLVLIIQAIALLACIGLPVLVLLFQRRLHLTRPTLWFLAGSLVALGADIAAVTLIPVTGNC